jgi:hypothetical protein
VHNPVFVDVLDSCQDLLHKLYGLSLIKSFSLHYVVKQFTPLCVLHDKMNVSFGFDNFVELYNVRVTENFEDTYFTGNAFDIGLFDDFLFL